MSRSRMARGWWVAALLLAVPSLAANMAMGQSAKPAMTVPEIRACICQEVNGPHGKDDREAEQERMALCQSSSGIGWDSPARFKAEAFRARS